MLPVKIRNCKDIFGKGNKPSGNQNYEMRYASAFLANEWLSDVTFYIPIDDMRIPAHSFILGPASPVLYRCCYGTGSIKPDKVITVPDYCTTEEVMIVLKYLYGDQGVLAHLLNPTNVGNVFKLADYFELYALENCCLMKIDCILSYSNVCSIFNQIYKVDNPMNDRCMVLFGQRVKSIIRQQNPFKDLELDALHTLLAPGNSLYITSESDLVPYLMEWADFQCLKQGIEANPVNRRKVTGILLYQIQFGALDFADFMHCVELCGTGFFTSDEVFRTVQQIHNQSKKENIVSGEYPFSDVKRLLNASASDGTEDLEQIERVEHGRSMAILVGDILHLNIVCVLVYGGFRLVGYLFGANKS